MKTTYSAIAALALVLAPFALAQLQPASSAPEAQQSDASTAVPPEQQATREQLAKLFELMRMRQQMNQLIGMMSSAMEQSIHQGMEQAMTQVPSAQQLTPEQQSKLDDILHRYMQKAMTVYTADEMIEDATAVYQRHLSRSDVDAYIAFYSSTPGQHFLDAQPVIMKEYMPIVMNKEQERSKALETEMMQEIADFVKSQAPKSTTAPAK
ncbi:MAG TPA: DUF2059 domain-containing protein [Terracidiphilus sp.]|nr:DUF2059 domain-containing protein [Terracidiphilus sp.]